MRARDKQTAKEKKEKFQVLMFFRQYEKTQKNLQLSNTFLKFLAFLNKVVSAANPY